MNWDLYSEYFFKSSDWPFIWLIPILFMLIISIKVFSTIHKEEMLDSTKQYLGANALFLLFYAGARGCFLFSNFYYETYPENYESYSEFQILIRTAYTLGLVGLTLLMFGVEKNFLKTKGIMASLPIICLVIALLLEYDTFRIITYVVQFIVVAVIFALYLYVTIKSTGEIRVNAISNLIGLILLMCGVMFDSVAGKVLMTDNNVRWLAYKVSPFVMMAGIGVLYYGWFKSIKS